MYLGTPLVAHQNLCIYFSSTDPIILYAQLHKQILAPKMGRRQKPAIAEQECNPAPPCLGLQLLNMAGTCWVAVAFAGQGDVCVSACSCLRSPLTWNITAALQLNSSCALLQPWAPHRCCSLGLPRQDLGYSILPGSGPLGFCPPLPFAALS